MRSFGESDLETVFSLMNTTLQKRGGNSYLTNCPFGHNHASGRDKHPSLSVIYGGVTSGWKCFGCNDKGTIRYLAKKYNEEFGDSRALEFIRSFDDKRSYGERAITKGSYESEQAKKIARMYKKAPDFKKPITEDELKYFLEEYPEYALERGIQPKQILKFEIGYDPHEDRMIVPVRDMHGKLLGVSGRAIDPERKPKWKHYPGLNKELVLYGERWMDIHNPTCFIVEGFFDVIALDGMGVKNIFATMGTSISDIQMQKLVRFFKNIIFIPDGEDVHSSNAGLKFAETYGKKLLIKIPRVGIAGVELNEKYEYRDELPAKWEETDFKYKIVEPLFGKDPSDLTQDEVKKVLQQTKWLSLI